MTNTTQFAAANSSANAIKADTSVLDAPVITKSLAMHPGFISETEFLTPDSLLAYCAMKLRGIDAQVHTAFTSQKNRNAAGSKLSELQKSMQQFVNIPADGPDRDARLASLQKDFAEAIRLAGGPDSPGGKRIAEIQANLELNAGVHGKQRWTGDKADVSPEELNDYAQQLGAIQKDLNMEGELEMIHLQSLMSMRQQAIQMCTNMVASLGQAANGVAQNIGK
jgi:hypothetical protein